MSAQVRPQIRDSRPLNYAEHRMFGRRIGQRLAISNAADVREKRSRWMVMAFRPEDRRVGVHGGQPTFVRPLLASGVAVGTATGQIRPLAGLWHEGDRT
jgi:hypothetical protein